MRERPLLLVVDDMPVNLALMRAMLRTEPYDVITASSGREALALLASEKPDLILLDILMPDMDGYQVLQQIKENPDTCHHKVVMLTAISELEDSSKAKQQGADGYLTKPVVMGRLKDMLNRLL